MRVLNCAFDQPLELEENAAMYLAGGIMQHGYQCGTIWGATLASGAQAYRLFGPGPHAETKAIIAAQRLVETFRAHNSRINCQAITGLNRQSSTMQMIVYFLLRGGSLDCFRRTTRYARDAFNEINDVFSKSHIIAPYPPVSCAAMLAKKVGLSDMHTVMVAGLAGGIGLCGGACGALGAAVWIIGMKSLKEGTGKHDLNDPMALDAIGKFLKCTDHKYECSEIVGRKFENVDDHADYLRVGGCSKIIEVLEHV